MGGCAGREIISKEERAIEFGVKQLGRSDCNARDLIINFKTYSKNFVLNINAMKAAECESKVKPKSNCEEFYERMRMTDADGTKFYDE